MFHHISKHLEFRKKYSAARSIFTSLLSVWKCDEILSPVFNILLEAVSLSLVSDIKSNLSID